MDFFKQLADLNLVGDLKLVIKNTGDKLIVSALLENEKCGDSARKMILPIVMNGTAAELDEGFFFNIERPLKATSGLMVNMEAHLKSVETATAQAAISKKNTEAKSTDKKDEPAKEVAPPVDPKKLAYESAMKKVDELEVAKKYKDAVAKLPDPTTYPDYADAIKTKRDQLVAKYQGLSIFA